MTLAAFIVSIAVTGQSTLRQVWLLWHQQHQRHHVCAGSFFWWYITGYGFFLVQPPATKPPSQMPHVAVTNCPRHDEMRSAAAAPAQPRHT